MEKIVLNPKIIGTEIHFRDFFLIVSHVLERPYHEMFFAETLELSEEQHDLLSKMIKKRKDGCPIAKIVGYKEFYGMGFLTNEHTLDPRPETEFIVELVKVYESDPNRNYSLLDLGCGTGCISLSILSLFKNATAKLVDIIPEALDVAIKNAKNCKVFERCNFINSDWFEKISGKYDVIVSNPPYVASDFILDKQTSFDPKIALFAGEKGLDAYKKIIPNCSNYLNKNGMMFLEIGIGQAEFIAKMLPPDLKIEKIQKDFAGIERVIVFRKNA